MTTTTIRTPLQSIPKIERDHAHQRFLLVIEGDVIVESKGVAPGACVIDPKDAMSLQTLIAEYVPVSLIPHVIRIAQERLI